MFSRQMFLKYINTRYVIFLSLLLLIVCALSCKPVNRDKDNNTFRMALSSEPPTLDWNLATDSISIRVIENIMEGLTQFDQELNPVPAVAKGWKVSDDGKTYTFFLRDSMKWSE